MAKDYESKHAKEYLENMLKKGLVLREMEPDGNCLFRSVADQLYGDPSLHFEIRKYVVEYLKIEKEYFLNFISEFDENFKSQKNKKQKHQLEKQEIETHQMNSNDDRFENYVKEMSEIGTWGDDVEIQIISEIYNRRVEIFYAFEETPMRTFHESQNQFQNDSPIRLSYHGKCHYNSIKSVTKERLIEKNIGIIEQQSLQNTKNRQREIKLISGEQGEEESKDLQNVCRQKFELIQNHYNTDQLYKRLIQEQYESSEFYKDNQKVNFKNSIIYEAEKFNILNHSQNQELALQLALEESRQMMEQSQQITKDKQQDIQCNESNKTDMINNQQNITEDNSNLSESDLEKIIVLNAVENAGFSRDQAEMAMQIVGLNEDLIVNYILENFM